MKLNANELGHILKDHGYDFFSGVPCSFLSNLINYAINEAHFVMSSNEGDAVACCAGAHLTGQKAVVLMQNSGLTNALSPLTSLNYSFQIPVLGFVSLRGGSGLKDEPQHELMGTITEKMLEMSEVEWEYLSADPVLVKEQFIRVDKAFNENRPFFFVVKKGTLDTVVLNDKEKRFSNCELKSTKTAEDELPLRMDVLSTLHEERRKDTVLLASTGKAGRELYEEGDAEGNLYMVGSMGCCSSMALGLSMNTSNEVISIEGDGALLMRMGNLATNAYYSGSNMLHILIDNNMHDSTGGQFTVSHNVDFVEAAAACGYSRSIYVHSLSELKERLEEWRKAPALSFFYIKVKPGTKENLGRPKIKPFEVKNRLMEFLK
jgi:phosphonopyruvate decarboxylase